MKNKVFKIGFILVALIFIPGGCEVSENNKRSCYPNRKIIKKAVNVKGRVGILDVNHPDVWSISSMEGIIGEEGLTYDSMDTVIPCDFPEELKKNDLIVRFSGILLDAEDDFTGGPIGGFYTHVYYAELSKIEVIKD